MLRASAVGPSRTYSAASPLLLFFASPFSTTASATASSVASTAPNRFAMSRPLRIAVVGDVHDYWELGEDSKALHFLQADLVLFTGDFGNENVELVRSISSLKFPKAAILGNHDCWTTQKFSEKKTDRVHLQLECFGDEHVGYCRLDFPMLKLCVLGGRPFSCGGDRLFRPKLLSSRYGVNDMEQSAQKIYEAALGTPEGHSVIVLAHNGPTGLGSKVSDICGRDWIFGGGDHGDPGRCFILVILKLIVHVSPFYSGLSSYCWLSSYYICPRSLDIRTLISSYVFPMKVYKLFQADLAQAISDLQRGTQIPIPLVIFGHMHKALAYGNGLRKMIAVGADNTIYLNAAIVPRVKHILVNGSGSSMEEQNQFQTSENRTIRAFTVVEFLDGRVEKIVETWVLVAGEKIELDHENVLFQKQ